MTTPNAKFAGKVIFVGGWFGFPDLVPPEPQGTRVHCKGCRTTTNIQSAIILAELGRFLFRANVPSSVDFVRIRNCKALADHGGPQSAP